MVRKNKVISGEIFKEPLLDVFLTDLEQISFSLYCPRPSCVAEGLRGREHPDSTVQAGGVARSFARSATGSASEPSSDFGRSQEKQPNRIPPVQALTRRTQLFALRSKVRTPQENGLVEGLPLANQTTYSRPFEEEDTSQQMTLSVKIGDYVHCGDKIGEFFETPPGSEGGELERSRPPLPAAGACSASLSNAFGEQRFWRGAPRR